MGVYPYLPLATNAPRTIWEILLKFNKFQYTKIHIIIIAVKWVFPSQNTPKSMSMHTSAPPNPLAGVKGAASQQEGNGGEGRTRGRREEGKGGGRENGEGGENGKVGE